MAEKPASGRRPKGAKGRGRVTLRVSTKARPNFDQPLAAFVFDGRGNLLERAEVKAGTLTLGLSPDDVARARVFLAPAAKELEDVEATPAVLERLGAYEPVLRAGLVEKLVEEIDIPGFIIDVWPYCFCFVRGRVVRASDDRPVCEARVRICEVDRLPLWIRELPDFDVLKLRDDLLDAIRKPIPVPEPRPPGPRPEPDPAPFARPLLRFAPQAEEPTALETASGLETVKARTLSLELTSQLESPSAGIVREALAANSKLILPYFCLWKWWWWRFRCDEMAVRTTDANGRFQAVIPYLCSGDRPDLYFWVEYDFGAGFETVYSPPLPCWTYWDYPCGTEVTIRVSDPRVPACNDEPDLPGKQVWVMSVGRTVSIGEIYTDAAGTLEGMVSEPFGSGVADFAFGGKLEPRVWFGREALIGDGITHYLWSVRPLGGTEADWTPLDRQVIRHYTTGGGTAPVAVMGPEAGGANVGRFRIRPEDPPAGGIEWLVADEREDLASAHWVTHAPDPPATPAPCGVEDLSAGKYELKLELFEAAGGNPVVWEDRGIVLRIATTEAPFGVAPVNTAAAGDYHRIKNAAAKTVAFRMVLHVDNSRSGADVQAVSGSGITVEPSCGVVTLTAPTATIDATFQAGRPGGLARFAFTTRRGLSTDIAVASAEGAVEVPTANGFIRSSPCTFSKTGIAASTLLGSCDQAAFAQHLYVWALTLDGYSRVALDASDITAFMLTKPCPPAEPPGGRPGGGRGGGRGRGRGGSGS